jgi:hypothetical protein
MALATLAGLSQAAHSQTPTPNYQSAAAKPRRAGQEGPIAPQPEGMWVSDEQPIAPESVPGGMPQSAPGGMPMQGMPMQSVPMNSTYGTPMANGMVDSALYGPHPAAEGEFASPDQGYVDEGVYGGPVNGHFMTDLWAEVHSHKRVYGRVQYLSMWTNGTALPPLVTTSPPGTPQDQAGRLDSPDTAILFGGERIDDGQRNGGRIDVGYWLVDGEFMGIEGHYLGLDEEGTTFNAVSDQPGGPILARPFTNVNPTIPGTPFQDAVLIAFPDFVVPPPFIIPGTFDLSGSINIRTSSDIQSAGALFRQLLWIDFTKCCRCDIVGGYRFFRYSDSVNINDESTTGDGSFGITSHDLFQADNSFHGGEIGLNGQFYHGRWSLDIMAKIALGNNRQKVNIQGDSTLTLLGATVDTPGGFLALPTNIGRYTHDEFAVLPELNATLRYDLNCHWRATVGYSLMYLNNVQKSGDAIDLAINPTQLNGGALVAPPFSPSFSFSNSDLFVHGINAGLEFRW